MKKWMVILLSIFLAVLIAGCSSNSSEESQSDDSSNSQDYAATESAGELKNKAEISTDASEQENNPQEKQIGNVSDRMVIYTANLSIQVNSYDDTLAFIQQELEKSNGYIVDSNSYSAEKDLVEGTLTVRIPQERFQTFLKVVEDGSTKVVDQSITGQDVTEEFVDLESRLKSKQVVEKRLLEFMEKAEKTEDLLKISTDLATVQEEIEQIKGRMNYLDNQVSLATVTIFIKEKKVNVPELENAELNTWEETKKQFMQSVNFLLQASSSIIVFFIGSLPILFVIGGLLIILWFIVKRKRKKQQGKPPTTLGE